MSLLLVIAVAWVALALPCGLFMGRALRVADHREQAAGVQSLVPDFIPAEVLASVAAADRGAR